MSETRFLGDWYIRDSSWSGGRSSSTSLSVGKYHVSKKGKKILEGAKKRFKYYNGHEESRDEADSKAVAFILSQGVK